MLFKVGENVVAVSANNVAQLAVCPRLARNGIHGVFRIADLESQNLKAVPRINFFSGCQAGLPPVGINFRCIRPAINLDVLECDAHGIRNLRRQPAVNLYRAVVIDDSGERIGEYGAGACKQTAPVAGMMRSFAKVDEQVKRFRAPVAERQCWQVCAHPRTV